MSPTRRRRTGDPTLDDAVATPGTVTAEVSDAVPDEPDWLRDAGAATPERDPTAPPAPRT